MSAEKVIYNQGIVKGVLVRSTPYTAKSGKMQRLDVLVPSSSPLEHPTTVSVHTDQTHSGQLNQEVEISYKAMTFLKTGKGKGSDTVFDQTRLVEV